MTTPAVPPPVVALETGPGIARYAVPGATTVTVTVVASAPCWVRARSGGPSGPTLFEGVLRPGERRDVTAGALWLRLGNPGGVRVLVNGAPVGLPAPSGRVLTLVATGGGTAGEPTAGRTAGGPQAAPTGP